MGSTNRSDRLLMIDGLRGIAAMMVVFYHLYANLKNSVSSWFPAYLDILLSHGNIGVHIFFVISGFVIAYSVGDKHVNLKFIGKFALRRSIRLDPPYWLSIVVAIVLIYLSTTLYADINRELPSTVTVLVHLLYLQDMLGYGNIVAVYWTLCLEVQFYLLFVVLVGLSQKVYGVDSTREVLCSSWVKYGLLALGCLSVGNYFELYSIGIRHTFLPYWHNFFLGVLACWCILGWIKPGYFAALWLVLLVFSVYPVYEINSITTLVTALAVLVAGMRHRLSSVFSGQVYQYLGRISYSLYLFHPIIGWRVISVGKRYLGPDLNWIEAGALFIAGVFVSVCISHLVFRFVERPSMAISHNIKLNAASNHEKEALQNYN